SFRPRRKRGGTCYFGSNCICSATIVCCARTQGGEAMIRKSPWALTLLLSLLCGAAQPAIAREGKSPQAFVATAAEAPSATNAAPNLKPGSEFKDCATCPPMIV